ncbi:TIGR02444 family protein [Shewanella donghaensis]|uniref:TIGR02444 family protein n=1 Tax=Shewanella donghaensis TaxID=238836 RepID=UPI0011836DCB|nr:TIGR02444 family protein [Shewanella donghaensis]
MQQFNSLIWRDCESLYASNPTSYISIQDDYQVNVNLLLLAQYLDQQAYPLALAQWETLAATIEDWDSKVVSPYRKLRRLAKSRLLPDEYQKMLDIELMMERKTQQMLQKKLNKFELENNKVELISTTKNYNADSYLCLFGINTDFFTALQSS